MKKLLLLTLTLFAFGHGQTEIPKNLIMPSDGFVSIGEFMYVYGKRTDSVTVKIDDHKFRTVESPELIAPAKYLVILYDEYESSLRLRFEERVAANLELARLYDRKIIIEFDGDSAATIQYMAGSFGLRKKNFVREQPTLHGFIEYLRAKK